MINTTRLRGLRRQDGYQWPLTGLLLFCLLHLVCAESEILDLLYVSPLEPPVLPGIAKY